MKNCEIKAIVDDLLNKDVPFILMIVADDDKDPCDHYYFSGNKNVPEKTVLEATVADMAMQLFESGNHIEDVKEFFRTTIEASYDWYNESKIKKLN